MRVLARLRSSFGIPIVFLHIVRINVNQLDDEIAVAAGSRSEEFGSEWAGDGEVVVEPSTDVAQNVGAMIDEALIGNFPGAPIARRVSGRNRPLTIWNRICRIGNVFAKVFRVA